MPPLPELVVGNACVGGACCVEPALRAVEVVGAPVGTDPGVPDVGNGRGVLEGGDVGLGMSVGGIGVEVGTDTCVSATMVKAAAAAVF